jgi:hypothetical protein
MINNILGHVSHLVGIMSLLLTHIQGQKQYRGVFVQKLDDETNVYPKAKLRVLIGIMFSN